MRQCMRCIFVCSRLRCFERVKGKNGKKAAVEAKRCDVAIHLRMNQSQQECHGKGAVTNSEQNEQSDGTAAHSGAKGT